MGREIEIKIPVSEESYNEFYNKIILGNGTVNDIQVVSACGDQVTKQDEYFSRYKTLEERRENNEPQVIRIRTEKQNGKNKSFFCIKRKNYVNGMEQNQETETFIEDDSALRIFFEEAGYFRWFNKVKQSYSAYCKLPQIPELEFHFELVMVNGLKYVEIEVTSEAVPAEQVLNSLETFVTRLGLNVQDKDPRSWYTIVAGTAEVTN